MSWAEVKKINSDMSKPLNTLIESETNKVVSTFNADKAPQYALMRAENVNKTIPASSSQNLVTITGTGVFYGAEFKLAYNAITSASSWYGSRITIKVDGNIMYDFSLNTEGTVGNYGTKKILICTCDAVGSYILNSGSSLPTKDNYLMPYKSKTYSVRNNNSLGSILNKPIIFNSSLVVDGYGLGAGGISASEGTGFDNFYYGLKI